MAIEILSKKFHQPTGSAMDALMSELLDPAVADVPRLFVEMAYPWGDPRYPLAKFKEPRKWQIEELEQLGDHIHTNKVRMIQGLETEVYRSATCSGHGTGKGAFSAFMHGWMMTTRIGSTTVSMANKEAQLRNKTWGEILKWHTMSAMKALFDVDGMAMVPSKEYEAKLKRDLLIDTALYYARGQLWSVKGVSDGVASDDVAGGHSQIGMLVIVDEASGLTEAVWKSLLGYFSDPTPDRYMFVFSNGRQNYGPFFECFHKFIELWRTRNIDSRNVEGVDRGYMQGIADQYGEDSDETRVMVRGLFPQRGDNQVFSLETIREAQKREIPRDPTAPLIMGIDVARYGGDSTCFAFRQGRDTRSIPMRTIKSRNLMEIAGFAARDIDEKKPDAVFIDETGLGAGVVDRLKELKYQVRGVNFGSNSTSPRYDDKRTEMWFNMAEWSEGGCLPMSQELENDLVGPQYSINSDGKLKLETKESMKLRGLASPDRGDAHALTFAHPVARKADSKYGGQGARRPAKIAQDVDYNVLDYSSE